MNEDERPPVGTMWRHRNGFLCEVIETPKDWPSDEVRVLRYFGDGSSGVKVKSLIPVREDEPRERICGNRIEGIILPDSDIPTLYVCDLAPHPDAEWHQQRGGPMWRQVDDRVVVT